jgi:hypothetical protein
MWQSKIVNLHSCRYLPSSLCKIFHAHVLKLTESRSSFCLPFLTWLAALVSLLSDFPLLSNSGLEHGNVDGANPRCLATLIHLSVGFFFDFFNLSWGVLTCFTWSGMGKLRCTCTWNNNKYKVADSQWTENCVHTFLSVNRVLVHSIKRNNERNNNSKSHSR